MTTYTTARQKAREMGLIQFSPEGIGMGEVAVEVKLTNSRDMTFAQEGYKKPEEIRSVEAKAIVDTGSLYTILPATIAERLGLKFDRTDRVKYADGHQEVVRVTEPVVVEFAGRRALQECAVIGDEVLIGQLALEMTDMFIDCKNQKLVPNPENPDYPVFRI